MQLSTSGWAPNPKQPYSVTGSNSYTKLDIQNLFSDSQKNAVMRHMAENDQKGKSTNSNC